MQRLLARLPALETLLWILASLAAFGAFLLLAPAFFSTPTAASTPPTVRPTGTPNATVTPSSSGTLPASPPDVVPSTPVPLPSLPAAAKLDAFIADPTQSGWIGSGESKPHWGDRNLHAGYFKGQRYQSLLYFDLTQIPPGSQIVFAEVDLTGLSRDNLGASGEWKLELLKPDLISQWSNHSVADFENAGTDAEIGTPLAPAEVEAGQVNSFTFAPAQYSLLEQAISTSGFLTFRLDGPTSQPDSLFTWDGAGLDLKAGAHPTLRLGLLPAQFIVVTNTPTPANVITAAAQVQTLNAFIANYGTPTPFPRNYATATPIIYVTAQPTPENLETRVAIAQYATAVAQTTGTFTPTPSNWIVITPEPPTATPGPTATPFAIPVGSLTPIASPTSFTSAEYRQTPIPDSISTSNGTAPFKNNIIFLSNRYGGSPPVLMQPDGTVLTALTGSDLYYRAAARDQFSPDQQHQVWYPKDSKGTQQVGFLDLQSGAVTVITNVPAGRIAYDAAWSPAGNSIAYVSTESGGDEIYVYDLGSHSSRLVTPLDPALFWYKHPSWSPDSQRIVFWSNRITQHAQIWVINADGSGLVNLSSSPYNDVNPVWVKP